jgi:hypothetical protein
MNRIVKNEKCPSTPLRVTLKNEKWKMPFDFPSPGSGQAAQGGNVMSEK